MKVSGTGITVIPMLPKCQVPESLPYRTEHPEVVGTGVDIVPNLHEVSRTSTDVAPILSMTSVPQFL